MLSREDWKSVASGALIAAGGSVLAWGTTFLIPFLQGSGDPKLLFLASALAVGINVVRKAYPNLMGGGTDDAGPDEGDKDE